MSTPWTIPQLVRWRVRDWASCFLVCRFSLDDESARYCTSTPTQMPVRTMVFAKKSINSRGKESSKKVSRRTTTESERRRNSSSSLAEEATVAVENGPMPRPTNDSSWPQFEDEDYIVFCFKEGGAFDVIKNGNSATSNCIDLVSASSRPVSRKLNYGGDDKTVKRSSREERLNGDTRDIYPTNDGDCIIPPQMNEEEAEAEAENIYLDTESATGVNRMKHHREVIDDRKIMEPTESSDSNNSDVSNGSFAFPVLGWEWSGSPVQMPKSEGLQLRKHKARCVGFQCCRF